MKGQGPSSALPADGAAEYLLRRLPEFRDELGLNGGADYARRAAALVRKFLWKEGVMYPAGLTQPTISRYLADLARQGRSRKTLLNHRTVLSGFCRFLIGRGLLAVNPCAAVRLRAPDERLPRYLDEKELGRALAIARRQRIWPEVCLALATGLRLSELIRLQWTDIDADRRCLAVHKSKTHRPRIVPLNEPALAALRTQRRISGRLRYVFPARRTCPGRVRYVDGPRNVNWWTRALRPIQAAVAKFASLPGRSTGRGWHLFRHTFASRAAQRGVSLYKLAAWLGHSDVRMTRVYAHLQDGYDPDIEAGAPL